MSAPAFRRTADTHRSGARTLEQKYYTSEDVLAHERTSIFRRHWNCVGRASELAGPGDFVTRDIAGDSVILVRDKSRTVRGFFNTCRHRGTELCSASRGRFGETIQCPYHAWTYSTDGRLLGAPHMQDAQGFDKTDYPLHQTAVAEWAGFLFVSIAENPAPFAKWIAPLASRVDRFAMDALSVHHRVSYDVEANWKLVFQNYSECLHCPVIHPELAAVLPYQSGANDLTDGPFLGGYMEITPPNESATMSGRACGPRISASVDEGRAYYYSLMPNMLLSIHPDYVNYYIVTPVDATHTRVDSEWMFAPGADQLEGFNPRDAIEFWDVTNRQDWDIVARSQRGIASSRYEPGPYSPRESIPAAWDRCYLELLKP